MIGVQDQRDIEHALHHLVRLFAGERVKEVARESQLRIALQDRLAGAQAIEGSDNGRRLRHQASGLLDIRLHGVVARLGIIERQHGHRGAQHVHGRGFRNLAEKLDYLFRDWPVLNQIGFERIQLRLLGQLAVPEQVDHFFKRRVLGQGVDVVALVTQDSQIPIDETDIRLGGNNPFEPRLCDWH